MTQPCLVKKYPLPLHVADLANQRFKYGELIPWDWLYQELEIQIPETGTAESYKALQFKILNQVENFREALLTRHLKATCNERGQGYRILRPDQQTKEALTRLRTDISKDIQNAIRLLAGVNRSLLTIQENQENANALGRVAALKLFTHNTLSLPSKQHQRPQPGCRAQQKLTDS